MTTPTLPARLERGLSHLVAATPTRVNRLLAGNAIRVDGQELHPDAQALLRARRALDADRKLEPIPKERVRVRSEARLVAGPTIEVGAVRPVSVPGNEGPLDARLYTAAGAPPRGPLTLYLHGGGWAVGDLNTHDQLCRYLCRRAGVRVLSVAYRLAPEHPFPAGLDDTLASFRFAAGDGATGLGADPERVAIAGDSAGANLATVACRMLRDQGAPLPAFQALMYPPTDFSSKRPSYQLFGHGFYLSEERMDRWHSLYLGEAGDPTDPRISPLLADDLAGLPPAYVLVAGFDPLRDEVRAYAGRLQEAGVEVAVGEELDLFHGFVNGVGISSRFRAAVDPLAAALAAALRD